MRVETIVIAVVCSAAAFVGGAEMALRGSASPSAIVQQVAQAKLPGCNATLPHNAIMGPLLKAAAEPRRWHRVVGGSDWLVNPSANLMLYWQRGGEVLIGAPGDKITKMPRLDMDPVCRSMASRAMRKLMDRLDAEDPLFPEEDD